MNNNNSNRDKPFPIDPPTHQKTSPKPPAVTTLPSVVTICLAPCDKCTGEYIDSTYSFRMRCCCRCHNNKLDRKEVSRQIGDEPAR
jgi:hypothetical protein